MTYSLFALPFALFALVLLRSLFIGLPQRRGLRSARMSAANRNRLRSIVPLVATIAFTGSAFGQLTAVPGISTVAGNGTRGNSGDGGPATSAAIGTNGVACDRAGNLYIVDSSDNVVRKVSPAGIITTVAGTGNTGYSGDGGPATSATLSSPYGIAVDSAGNLYIADSGNERVRVVQMSSGIISTYAGNGTGGSTGDGGPAVDAELNYPVGLVFDTQNDLYIATAGDNKVRMVSSQGAGLISTIAGTGVQAESGDGGPATKAALDAVFSLALDSSNNLYISELSGNRIRKVTAATGIITTFAGTGASGYGGDGGPATSATLNEPMALAFDSAGRLYFMDSINNVIRSIYGGIIDTVAGNGNASYSGDGGPAIEASLNLGTIDQGLAFDANGNLYVSDISNHVVRKISPLAFPSTNVGSSAVQNLFLQTTAAETIGSFTVPASIGNKQEYVIGTVTGCAIDGKTTNAAGTICTLPITFAPAYPGRRPVPLLAATSGGNATLGLNGVATAPLATLTPGIITAVAGNYSSITENGTDFSPNGDGGPATKAEFFKPSSLCVDSAGNYYVVDFAASVVRRIDGVSGIITTFAGFESEFPSYSGDGGPATQASLQNPQGIALDSAGNLYIADTINQAIRKVTASTGIITTVAGNGSRGFSGDGGLATSAQLYNPQDVAVDSAGNLYIADTANSAIRKVTASTGIITTIAGNGSNGYTGDGGPAVSAQLSGPLHLALDGNNNLYITDSRNGVVRKIDAVTGIISTYAGDESSSQHIDTGDGGPATQATLIGLEGVATDAAGNVYISDEYLIRKVEAATGIISTIAGTPLSGYSSASPGDGGPATKAIVYPEGGFAVEGDGTILLVDTAHFVVRSISTTTSALNYPTSTPQFHLDTVDDPQTAILSNIGNQPLLPLSGNGAITSSWAMDETSTCFPFTSLASGSSCTLPVDFDPTESGALTGTLSLVDNSLNANPATQIVPLSGTATASGRLTISPSTQTFAATAVGNSSNSLTSTLTNGTATTIALSAGTLTDATDFNQSDNCKGTIISGAACTVTFTFTPQSTGTLTSTYSIGILNNSDSNVSVALSGAGTAAPAPQAVLSPTSLAFIAQANAAAGNQNVTLSNPGNAPLTISSVAIGGVNAASFSIASNNCGTSLAAGGTCTIAIGFPAAAAGTYSATLAIADNASPTTQTASLTGTVNGIGQATLTPTSIDFGNVTQGTTAASKAFTLANVGTASYSITSIALSGANSSSFAVAANTCGASLAVGSSCTIAVSFTPSATVQQTASLTVVDSIGTQASSLSGVGIAPPPPPDFTLAATPAAQTSYLGQSVTYQLAVAPLIGTNPFNSAVTFTVTGLPAGATASFAPASVTPGAATASSVMTVTIPALSSGNRNLPAGHHPGAPPIAFATLLAALGLARFKRMRRQLSSVQMLFILALIGGLCAAITACSGTGFAVPQTSSTMTVTGTSGTLTHTANVTLTLK